MVISRWVCDQCGDGFPEDEENIHRYSTMGTYTEYVAEFCNACAPQVLDVLVRNYCKQPDIRTEVLQTLKFRRVP